MTHDTCTVYECLWLLTTEVCAEDERQGLSLDAQCGTDFGTRQLNGVGLMLSLSLLRSPVSRLFPRH